MKKLSLLLIFLFVSADVIFAGGTEILNSQFDLFFVGKEFYSDDDRITGYFTENDILYLILQNEKNINVLSASKNRCEYFTLCENNDFSKAYFYKDYNLNNTVLFLAFPENHLLRMYVFNSQKIIKSETVYFTGSSDLNYLYFSKKINGAEVLYLSEKKICRRFIDSSFNLGNEEPLETDLFLNDGIDCFYVAEFESELYFILEKGKENYFCSGKLGKLNLNLEKINEFYVFSDEPDFYVSGVVDNKTKSYLINENQDKVIKAVPFDSFPVINGISEEKIFYTNFINKNEFNLISSNVSFENFKKFLQFKKVSDSDICIYDLIFCDGLCFSLDNSLYYINLGFIKNLSESLPNTGFDFVTESFAGDLNDFETADNEFINLRDFKIYENKNILQMFPVLFNDKVVFCILEKIENKD